MEWVSFSKFHGEVFLECSKATTASQAHLRPCFKVLELVLIA